MFTERLSLLILFFALPSSAGAENGPPSWLLGKSIVLQYSEARSFEPVEQGHGRAHNDTVDSRTTIYISDRGRIFAQAQRTVEAGRANRSFSLVKSPDTTSQNSDWRFEGETLFGLSKLGQNRDSTVKRVAVQFGQDSHTCTIGIVYARPRGTEFAIIEGWYGDYYYLRHDELTSSACEVKAGNIFDGAR